MGGGAANAAGSVMKSAKESSKMSEEFIRKDVMSFFIIAVTLRLTSVSLMHGACEGELGFQDDGGDFARIGFDDFPDAGDFF